MRLFYLFFLHVFGIIWCLATCSFSGKKVGYETTSVFRSLSRKPPPPAEPTTRLTNYKQNTGLASLRFPPPPPLPLQERAVVHFAPSEGRLRHRRLRRDGASYFGFPRLSPPHLSVRGEKKEGQSTFPRLAGSRAQGKAMAEERLLPSCDDFVYQPL